MPSALTFFKTKLNLVTYPACVLIVRKEATVFCGVPYLNWQWKVLTGILAKHSSATESFWPKLVTQPNLPP